jgi:hypothetical protein
MTLLQLLMVKQFIERLSPNEVYIGCFTKNQLLVTRVISIRKLFNSRVPMFAHIWLSLG